MDGQIAVGNVVLNRVADERFPNSVKEVVFDRRGGVAQFSPTADGRISLTPDEDAELAAKLAFEGYDPVGESLYFINPSACNASWFNSRLTYTATIGDHVFYA
jgi:N-acetylmuramoyl-L-alanine amidase